MPLTMPDEEPTVARPVLPLFQAPPVVPSLNAVVSPAHNDAVPEIAGGNGLTTTAALPAIAVVQELDGFVAITV
jgi:hypothetical protein